MKATGSIMRIVTNHQPPLVYVASGQNSSGNSYSGFLVDLLPILLQQAGINQSYTFYTVEGSGGVQLPNGSWTAIMGELSTGRADLALFPLTLTSTREPYIQHTQPIMDGGYGILVQAPTFDPGYSFLMPFGPLTWGMVFVALMFTVVLLVALDYITRHARLKAVGKALGKQKKRQVKKSEEVMNHAIETVMMAVGSGSAPGSHSCSVKFLFVSWAIFCIIMLSAYTANLSAKLTVNQMAPPVQSLVDLAQMSAKFAVPSDSAIETYFEASSDQYARMLRPHMVPYVSTDAAADDVRAGTIAALVGDYVNVQYLTQVPPCGLAMSNEVMGSGSLVLGLHPNSTLAPALNTALLELGESGAIGEMKRKWFAENNQCAADAPAADMIMRIGIDQVWPVYVILGAGAAAGVIVAALEVIYYNKLFAGMHQFRQSLVSRRKERSLRGAPRAAGTPAADRSGLTRDLESPKPKPLPQDADCS